MGSHEGCTYRDGVCGVGFGPAGRSAAPLACRRGLGWGSVLLAMSEWRRFLLLAVVCGLAVVGALVIQGGPAAAEGEVRSALEVVQVDVGGTSVCVVTAEHQLVCGGENESGQTEAPAGRYTQVSAGGEHSCAVGEDGALSCWGMDGGLGTRVHLVGLRWRTALGQLCEKEQISAWPREDARRAGSD